MKVMKKKAAMKAMKVMKKKSVSVIAHGDRARASVFLGFKVKTVGGLQKSDLMMNKSGRIVSKKASKVGKKFYNNIKGWTVAYQKAKKALGLKGFIAIKKGSPVYKKAK